MVKLKIKTMMRMKISITAISWVLLTSCACKKWIGEDDQLSIPKIPYNGTEIRINGYWYTSDRSMDKKMSVLFFYKNGIILNVGDGYDNTEINFVDNLFLDRIKDNKTCWGVFKIAEKDIFFERWYFAAGGKKTSFVNSGKILNDTTFHITESYRMQGGNKTEVSAKDEVYHFKAFSPKPDSTNTFVP
jgi:hypothetical protein